MWLIRKKMLSRLADKYGYNVLVASSNESFEKEKKNIDVFLANRTGEAVVEVLGHVPHAVAAVLLQTGFLALGEDERGVFRP